MATYFNQYSDEEILLAMRYSGSGKPPPYSFQDLIRKLGGLIEVGAFSSTLRRLEEEGKVLSRGSTAVSRCYWDRASVESGEIATVLSDWWEEFAQSVHEDDSQRSAELLLLEADLEDEEEDDWDSEISASASP